MAQHRAAALEGFAEVQNCLCEPQFECGECGGANWPRGRRGAGTLRQAGDAHPHRKDGFRPCRPSTSSGAEAGTVKLAVDALARHVTTASARSDRGCWRRSDPAEIESNHAYSDLSHPRADGSGLGSNHRRRHRPPSRARLCETEVRGRRAHHEDRVFQRRQGAVLVQELASAPFWRELCKRAAPAYFKLVVPTG